MTELEIHEQDLDGEIFATIAEAIEDIRDGKIVLVVDDADRENEGDFIMAADFATPEAVNFMVTHGRGIVCLPCAAWRLDELGIPQMVTDTTGGHEAAFTVSIDFRQGTTTGTSAHDRAITAKAVDQHGGHTARLPEAGPRLPVAGEGRRRAPPRGTHRGRGRPRHDGRPLPRGRDLRGDERGRHDGAHARARSVWRGNTA